MSVPSPKGRLEVRVGDAGAFGWLSVVIALLASAVAVGLCGAALSGRRIPISAFLLLPFCAAAVGAVGSGIIASGTLSAVIAADGEATRLLALSGAAGALDADIAGRWGAAFAFCFAAWGSGLGSTISAREDYKWTIEQAVLAAGAGLIATIVTLGLSVWWGVGFSGVVFSVVVLLATAGVAAGSVRRTFYEDAPRVACLRFGAAVAAILAIMYAGNAMTVGADAAVSAVAGADQGIGALTAAFDRSSGAMKLSWVGFVLGGAAAVLGFLPELGDIVSWPTVLDLSVGGLVWAIVGLARLFEVYEVGNLDAIGTALPALQSALQLGGDIPTTTMQFPSEVRWARPPVSRFSDVVVFMDKRWVLRAAWDGQGWTETDQPWTEAQKHDDTLFVAASGLPVSILADAIAQLPSKKGSLLVRSGEVSPAAEARLAANNLGQVYFALSPPEKRDIARNSPKMAWASALKGPVFKGPIAWFGKNEGLSRGGDANGAVAETGGLLVSLADGARVDDLVSTCLAGVWKDSVKKRPICLVTNDGVDVLRSEAEMGFVAAPPTTMTLSGTWPANLVGADVAWAREAAALEFAAKQSKKPPAGTVAIFFEVAPDGQPVNLSSDKEKSTVIPEEFVQDVARRIVGADWPKPTDGKMTSGVEVFVTFNAPLPPAK